MMYFKHLIIVFAIDVIGSNVYAESEKSLKAILNSGQDFAKGAAHSDKSLEVVPGFSYNKVKEEEQKLGSIQVDDRADNLKIQGEQERDRQSSTNPDGITATMVSATDISRVTGDKCSGCDKLVEHELFTRADKLIKDPISQFELIKGEGCKEIESKKRRGFYRLENIEEVTDKVEELRICETPVLQFNNCQKTLSVKCKKVISCDYGGITKGSVSEGIAFDASKGYLTIGTDADNYFKGTCATFNNRVSFYLAKVESITVFKLVHVKFDDFIEIKLNDQIIYVGPYGGNYVKVQGHEVEEERERYVPEPIITYGRLYGVRQVKQKYKEKIKKTEVYNGNEYKSCEQNTSWDSNENLAKVNIDLRPYLKGGKNILEMKIIVSGEGEGWLKIEARQQCCGDNEWESSWEEFCE